MALNREEVFGRVSLQSLFELFCFSILLFICYLLQYMSRSFQFYQQKRFVITTDSQGHMHLAINRFSTYRPSFQSFPCKFHQERREKTTPIIERQTIVYPSIKSKQVQLQPSEKNNPMYNLSSCRQCVEGCTFELHNVLILKKTPTI